MALLFETRTLFFEQLNRKVTVFMQNENGPCMLLAVLNALSLKGRVKIAPGTYDADTLIAFVMDICPEAGDLGYLANGCDIIPCFSSCKDFRDYPNFLSDLKLTMLHAMIPDPESKIFELVVGEDYDSLTLKLTDDNVDVILRAELENWWDVIQQQVTKIGLEVIDSAMQNGDIAIFFRANHFCVLFKTMNRVFSLVTDKGFMNTNCFWESLPDERGASKFFDDKFILSSLEQQPSPQIEKRLPRKPQNPYSQTQQSQETYSRILIHHQPAGQCAHAQQRQLQKNPRQATRRPPPSADDCCSVQ